MNDSNLMYTGIFVFSLILIGMALTVMEFRNLNEQNKASSEAKKAAVKTGSASETGAKD